MQIKKQKIFVVIIDISDLSSICAFFFHSPIPRRLTQTYLSINCFLGLRERGLCAFCSGSELQKTEAQTFFLHFHV